MNSKKSTIVPIRIYNKLFSSTYLHRKRVRISHFTNLVDFLTEEKFGKSGVIEVHSLDYELQWNLKDLAEKLGFIYLSRDLLYQKRRSGGQGGYKKYYFYNLIIYCKACLDTIAVTLNNHFDLGFRRGDIDLRKAPFLRKIEHNFVAFSNFRHNFGEWIEWIVDYRDALIHQKCIEILPITPKGHRKSVDGIPLFPLSMEELDQLLEQQTANINNQHLEQRLSLIPLSDVIKQIIDNLLSITGLLSLVLLQDLKTKFPNHTPSSKALGTRPYHPAKSKIIEL